MAIPVLAAFACSSGDADRCPAGATECRSGTTIARCGSDGSGWAVEACPEGTACEGSACVAASCPEHPCADGKVCAYDGTCVDRACEPGGHRCHPYTSLVDTCDAAGAGWDGPAACPDGQACEDGECRDVVCAPAETRCSDDGTGRETCRAYGTGWTLSPCGSGLVCEEAECRAPVCTPEAIRCRMDFGAVERCLERGTAWVEQEPCPDGRACSGGSCMDVICEAGEWECAPDFASRRLCDGSGTAQGDPQDCAGGTACRDGECRAVICMPGASTCTPDATGRLTCDGTGTRNDLLTPCDDAEACVAGACVPASSPLGEVLVVRQAQGAVPLSPGWYAGAVVDVSTTADPFPFPLAIQGVVADAAPALRRVARIPSPPPGPSWRCGTPMARAHVPALRSAPRITVLGDARLEAVGDTRTFVVMEPESGFLTDRTALLRKQGDRANFWEDVTDGDAGGSLPQSTLQDIADRLDDGVFARDVALFGQPTDVDGNGRIDVLFTSLLPSASAAAYVWPVTLLPPGSLPYATDHGEVVYSMPPGAGYTSADIAGIIAHETAHLLVEGRRIEPWLDDIDHLPSWVMQGDVYLGEGLAELGHGWSGQGLVQSPLYAMNYPSLWILGGLFQDDYYMDGTRSMVHYGLGALIVGYLFQQSGGVQVTGPDAIEDLGGIGYLAQVEAREQGFPRIQPPDGREPEEWYADFATALVLAALPHGPGPVAGADPRFRFPSLVRDPWFGGFVGLPARQSSGDPVSLDPWGALSSTMSAGGARFFQVTVTGETTVSVGRDTATAILVRSRP